MSGDHRPSYEAKLLISTRNNDDYLSAKVLHPLIISASQKALRSSSSFILALSGGSLPKLLSTLPSTFESRNEDAQWDKWHIIFADERCVVPTASHPDSNLALLKKELLDHVPIPADHIYGIDDSLLAANHHDDDDGAAEERVSAGEDRVALDYDKRLKELLSSNDDKMIDCAVLGFGPDGHTCSLFPDHRLLLPSSAKKEGEDGMRLIDSLFDSPKPPPRRITLTVHALLYKCQEVVFCGTGEGKRGVLRNVFEDPISLVTERNDEDGCVKECKAIMKDPAPFPCGMVRPEKKNVHGSDYNGCNLVTWVVDEDAASDLVLTQKNNTDSNE